MHDYFMSIVTGAGDKPTAQATNKEFKVKAVVEPQSDMAHDNINKKRIVERRVTAAEEGDQFSSSDGPAADGEEVNLG